MVLPSFKTRPRESTGKLLEKISCERIQFCWESFSFVYTFWRDAFLKGAWEYRQVKLNASTATDWLYCMHYPKHYDDASLPPPKWMHCACNLNSALFQSLSPTIHRPINVDNVNCANNFQSPIPQWFTISTPLTSKRQSFGVQQSGPIPKATHARDSCGQGWAQEEAHSRPVQGDTGKVHWKVRILLVSGFSLLIIVDCFALLSDPFRASICA